MIKNILALFLCLLTLTSHASSAKSLKDILDEFNYSMTVKWDQKDPGFRDAQMRKLSRGLVELHNQGLTQSDMVNLIANELDDGHVKKEIELVLASVDLKKISPDVAQNLMIDIVTRGQPRGASWSVTGTVVTTVWGIFATAAVGYLIFCSVYEWP